MSGPWEDFQQTESAPWEDFRSAATDEQGSSQGYLSGIADMLAQGATFGFGDEITAGEAAILGKTPEGGLFQYDRPFAERYRRALEAERGQQSQFRQERPASSLVAEATGAVVPFVTTPLGAIGRVAQGASLATKTGKAMLGGGFGGALYGAGSAEGDIGDRAIGATLGGGLGAAFGGVAAPLIAGAGHGANLLYNQTLGRIPSRAATPAARKAVEALARDGLGLDDVSTRLNQLGPDASIMDTGIGSRRLAGAVSRIPGDASKTLDDFVRARQEGTRVGGILQGGQGNRVLNQLDDVTPARYRGTLDDLAIRRAKEANPLYRRAFSEPVGVTDRIQTMVDDPLMKKGLAQGLRIQRLEALAKGEPFNPGDAAVVAFNEAGDPILGKAANMRTLDAIKKGLDGMIEKEIDPVTNRVTQEGRALIQVKNAFLDEIDSPAYAAAREAWEGPSKLIDAMQEGRKFLSRAKGRTSEDVAARIKKMSADEKAYFRLGAVEELRGKIGAASTRSDITKKLKDQPDLERRVRAAFGDDKTFRKFIDALEGEAEMFKTYAEITGGSPTAQRLAAQGDLRQDPGALSEMAMNVAANPLNPVGYLRGLAAFGNRALMHLEMPEIQRARLAEILAGRDTAALQPVMARAPGRAANSALASQAAANLGVIGTLRD